MPNNPKIMEGIPAKVLVIISINFNNLPDFPVEYSTDNIVRKAKKKLREIEVLKTKESITPEEKQKMKLEKYWKIFIPSSYTLFENNNHNITHSFRIHPVQKEEECPICLNKIRNIIIFNIIIFTEYFHIIIINENQINK
jgi:hypothetical protein